MRDVFLLLGKVFLIDGTANETVEMKNSYRVFVKEGATNYSQFNKNANKSVKSLTIRNPLLMNPNTCNLYDVVGKIISAKKDLRVNSSCKFSTKDKIEVGKKNVIKKLNFF